MTRCTQADIADRAGVSINTVSNALRGRGRVAPATAERIRAIARDLGYRPDPLLAALNRRRRFHHAPPITASVAVLIAGPLGSNLLRGFWRGLQQRAEALGYVLHRVDTTRCASAVSRQIIESGVQGLVIMPHADPITPVIEDLPWERLAAVAIGAGSARFGVDHVIVDHHALIGQLWQRLKHAGYQRIGTISSREHEAALFGTPYGATAAWAMSMPEMHWCRPLIPERTAEIAPLLEAWLARERPEVVIAHPSAPLHLPALRRVPRCTLTRSPRDRMLAGFDRRPTARGRVALDHLHELIHNDRCGRPLHPMAIHVPARWVDGGSLALKG